MQAKRGRLQARMARYIAVAVVVSLVASTAGVIIYRFFSARLALETSARNYAGLVAVPLAQIANMYGESGERDPVKSRVVRLLNLNPDVERLDLARLDGKLELSATRREVLVWPWVGSAPTVGDHGLVGLEVLRNGDAGRVRIDGRNVYRVVIPGDEEGQTLALVLVATFNYDRVNHQLQRGLLIMILALALGLVVTERVSFFLARGITKNLANLQSGVRRIRAGRLDERVSIRSGDEVQELADAFNNMTEDLQQTIGRLHKANLELQALDQLKIDLVANVSHELRTPLTALKGFLELLDEGELGELSGEAHRAVGVCRRNVDRLALRVEDLVELSQVEKAWPEDLEFQTVDLLQIISVVTEVFEARIRSKKLRFTFTHPPGLPEVLGNSDQLERVVLNLTDNAVKFTPEGGSLVIAAEECDHEGVAGILVRFTDSGIGIPPSELVRVFDRFHQVDQSTRRRFGGMGLGLAVVHHIIEAHRGVVWVESDIGSGSTFYLWLPCRSDDDGL